MPACDSRSLPSMSLLRKGWSYQGNGYLWFYFLMSQIKAFIGSDHTLLCFLKDVFVPDVEGSTFISVYVEPESILGVFLSLHFYLLIYQTRFLTETVTCRFLSWLGSMARDASVYPSPTLWLKSHCSTRFWYGCCGCEIRSSCLHTWQILLLTEMSPQLSSILWCCMISSDFQEDPLGMTRSFLLLDFLQCAQ